MRPNSNALALRDAALATALGALAPRGADFGVDYGFGADYQFGGDPPTAENMARAWQEKQATRGRLNLLEPNRNSEIKVQKYTFAVGQTITLETVVAISASQSPQTHIRPQRLTSNSPCPGFVRLSSIQVANVGVIVGGDIDSFDVAAQAQDAAFDLPTLSPANAVQVTGDYDDLLPDGGYVTATAFRWRLSFKGPANMVA